MFATVAWRTLAGATPEGDVDRAVRDLLNGRVWTVILDGFCLATAEGDGDLDTLNAALRELSARHPNQLLYALVGVRSGSPFRTNAAHDADAARRIIEH